jgi:hypothetical protein
LTTGVIEHMLNMRTEEVLPTLLSALIRSTL